MSKPIDKFMEDESCLFKDFSEYWHYTRCLTQLQRDLVFASLSPRQQHILKTSYNQGSWEDVVIRDSIDKIIDQIRTEFGFDMIEVRSRVLRGKNVYLPRVVWEYLSEELAEYPTAHTLYVLGGISSISCKSNNEVVLVIKAGSDIRE